MSNPARRREKQIERANQQIADEEEQRRKNSLSMWERIEESDASADVKDILHRMAEFLGLEG